MKKRKSNLDEMQEQKMLHIEHNMAWLAWGGLLVAICGQLLLFGPQGIQYIWGEWIIFMVLCVYLSVDCIRNGLYDRYIKPDDKKTQFLLSLVGSLVGAAVVAVIIYRGFESLKMALIFFVAVLVICLTLCILALYFANRAYRKRVAQLENPPE